MSDEAIMDSVISHEITFLQKQIRAKDLENQKLKAQNTRLYLGRKYYKQQAEFFRDKTFYLYKRLRTPKTKGKRR